MSIIDPHYNQFTDDSPNRFSPRFEDIKEDVLPSPDLPKVSETHPNEEIEETALIVQEVEISKMFAKFTKDQSITAFRTFVNWVESKKPFTARKIYNGIKKFKFFRNSEYEWMSFMGDKISCMAISPKNQFLAIGSLFSPIKLIDFPEKKIIGILGHEENINKVYCMAMSDDFLFSAGWDKIIRKWNIFNMSLEDTLVGHRGPILVMVLTPDTNSLISSGEDRTIIVWDLILWKMTRQIIAHNSPISALDISLDGERVVSASWDKTIKIWKFRDFQLEFTLKGHTDIIRTIALSTCGRILASSGKDCMLKVWDLGTKSEKYCFQDHKQTVLALKFTAYGDYLISSGNDHQIKIWNLQKNKLKKTHNARTEITSILMTMDGRKFITGGGDKTVKLWIVENESEMRLSEKCKDDIMFLATFPDNLRGITCLNDGTLKVWNIMKGSILESISIENGGVSAVEISKDGKFFAIGDNEGYLTICKGRSYQTIKREKVHSSRIIAIKFHLMSQTIIFAGEDTIKILGLSLEPKYELLEKLPGKIAFMELGFFEKVLITSFRGDPQIYLWTSLDLKKMGQLYGHTNEITSMKTLMFSTKLITGSLDLTIKVWNLQSKSLEISINTSLQVLALELSNDAFTIVASHNDGTLRLWDAETGEQMGRTSAYPSMIRKISLTHDGSTLLTVGGKANGLKKILLNKIKSKIILTHHNAAINVLAMDRDKTILVAGSEDARISICMIQNMEVKSVLKGHSKGITNLVFGDSNTLISASSDRTLRVWNIKEEKSYIIFDGVDINDILYHDCENAIIASCSDSKLRVFSLEEKKLKNQYNCDTCLTKIIRNYNGNFLYAGDSDGNLLEYDLETLIEKRRVHSDWDSVIALAISHNDSRLFSSCCSSSNIVIKIYNTQDFTLINKMYGHLKAITSIVINSKSTRIFSGSCDSKIMIWDALNFKKIGEFKGHTDAIRSLVLDSNEDSIFSGSDDKSIRGWNLKDSRKIPFLEGHSHKILKIAISPNNEFLVSGDENDSLLVWDIIQNKLRFSLKNSNGSNRIQGLGITNDNLRIVVCNEKGKVVVWDLKTGVKIQEFEELDKETVSRMILSNELKEKAIISYSDFSIRTLDLEVSMINKRFLGHKGIISDIVMTQDWKKMASVADDGKLIIWDYQKQEIIQNINEKATVLVLNCDNTFLISGFMRKFTIFNFRNLEILKVFEEINAKGSISDMKVSPDNQKLFIGFRFDSEEENIEGIRNVIKVWSLKKFESLPYFNEEKSLISCDNIAISNDKEKIYVSHGKTITLYNYDKCDLNSVLSSGSFDKITAETMSPDKQFVIIADTDRRITIWDLQMREQLTQFIGHTEIVTCLIATKQNLLISASNDMTIKIWSINEKKELDTLYGHISYINAIAISNEEDRLLSTSAESGIILWDLNTTSQIHRFQTEENFIYALVFFPDSKHFVSAGDQQILWIWSLENLSEPPKILAIFPTPVSKIVFSPDLKIMLIFSLEELKMQIWDTKNYTIISESPVKSDKSQPVFLTHFDNRLILCEDRLIDCLTGHEIFHFSPKEGISSYFYDYKNNKFFYISDSLKLYQFNSDWFGNYLYEYLTYDSLLSLKNDISVICNRQLSVFPYFFTYLHLIAIYDKSEDFTLEKIREMYKEISNRGFMRIFHSVDIFLQTPLDILIQRKNTTLIMKYFKMLFEIMKDGTIADFDSKARFFHYSFREDYTILNLLCDLLPLIGEDLSVLAGVLDNAFISFDSSIYDNDLLYEELDEPVLIENDSMYTNKVFLGRKLNEILKKTSSNKEIKEYEREIEEILKKPDKILKIEENKSIVKAKILCLPGIFDLNRDETRDFYELLSHKESDNAIFTNKILALLVNFIWEHQIKFYYYVEFCVFFFFFLLYNINFALLLQLREVSEFQDTQLSLISGVIDILLFSYSLFTFVNEMKQLYQNLNNYFRSIWNYIDILIIPLLLLSSAMDFLLHFFNFISYLSYIKILFAICMSCFWFRLLSFSRGFKETSSMIRLIFNVISGVKYFVLFMVLFMLNFSSSLYLLRNTTDDETDESFWNTFLVFYSSAVGDTSGIIDYDILFPIQNFYMILATFLFAIISINLLVSIIGDKHNENNENEEKTRVYELLNIIVDTDSSLVSAIVKKIRGGQKNGQFLIQLYNDKHENTEESDNEKILNKLEEVQWVLEEQSKKIEEKIEMVKKGNEGSLEKIETKISKVIMENEKQKGELEQYLKEMKEILENKKF